MPLAAARRAHRRRLIGETDHQTRRSFPRETPDERWIYPVTDVPRDVVDRFRIFLVIAENVPGGFVVPVPDRPVVRTHVEDVRRDLFVVGDAFVHSHALRIPRSHPDPAKARI